MHPKNSHDYIRSKGFERNCAHISYSRCPYGRASISHAATVAPEVETSTRAMWLVADYMVVPIDHFTKHRQCSIQVSAVAVWWCKRWLSRHRESPTDRKSIDGHQGHLTADIHGHHHHLQRPIPDAQPSHVANAAHRSLRIVRGQHGTTTRP